jgi:amino acid transporter
MAKPCAELALPKDLADTTTSRGELVRDFSLRTAFSLAFAFISPIVALYSIFSLALASSGPGFWLGFPIATAGQLLVALVFSMLVSRYPFEGSVYQWSKQLVNARYGWFAGWTYIWTLVFTMTTVALGGAHFLSELVGFDPANKVIPIVLALGLLCLSTWGNTHGRQVLSMMVALCVGAELIGSIGVGTWLLVTGRMHSPSIIFSGSDFLSGSHGWLGFFDSKAAAAVAICGWAFVGFESAGSIAEEVKNPSRNIPRAMLYSLLFVAAVVTFSGLAFLLAVPDLAAAVAGNGDPVVDTLIYHFGPVIYRVLLVLFVIGFLACLLGVQTSASRVVWAFARDGELPFSHILVRLTGSDSLPANAIVLVGALAALIFALASTDLYAILVAFTIAGFYIAFGFPVLGAAAALLRGQWVVTPFDLGRFTAPTILAAAAWIIFETINIAWPRLASAPWYMDWAVALMVAFLGGLGVAIRAGLDRRVPLPDGAI